LTIVQIQQEQTKKGRAVIARRTMLLGALAAMIWTASPAVAGDITGAGATFPYPIYAKWAEAYKPKTDTSMNRALVIICINDCGLLYPIKVGANSGKPLRQTGLIWIRA